MAVGVRYYDPEKFVSALNMMADNPKTSFKKAAEVAGMSEPTFRKYFIWYCSGKPFPDTLFWNDKGRDLSKYKKNPVVAKKKRIKKKTGPKKQSPLT